MRRHERPQIPNLLWVSHSNLHESENFFTKPMPPLDPSTSDLQDPKISGPNDKPRASGDIGVSFTRHLTQPRVYTCHMCPPVLWRLYDVTAHYGMTRLPRPTRFDPFILTQSEPPAKKKKKKLWPIRPLTLTKKSKFSKMACSTQFFEYIPILRSVSSFEAWKLCKLSNS